MSLFNRKRTVLIIDDEDGIRGVVTMTLRDAGYETLEAEDGVEGLEMAMKEKPDLVLCDVNMDNMNGFMVVEELQKDPKTSKIPVILMTGVAKDAGAWNSVGAVDYIEKPFAIEKLLETVKRVLEA
ncbi:MAG: response regulator [Bacteroidota bacterium]